jgi:tetratricopeptide (TPR) repeat protein
VATKFTFLRSSDRIEVRVGEVETSFSANLAAVFVLAIALLAAPLGAQNLASSGHPGLDGPAGASVVYDSDWLRDAGTQSSTLPLTPAFESLPGPQIDDDEICLTWPALAVRGYTVSVMTLQVPSKARSEFEKACGDVKKSKLLDAEQHVRNAIEKYPNYVAAWVMLGLVLEGLQRTDEALNACEHALSADPTYVPPYLCLTEISLGREQWDSVLNLTESALRLNPAAAGYAYFFRATAYYRTQRLAEAEKCALDAIGTEWEQGAAPIYLLLAQIYEAEGKSDAAVAQLRHSLKLSPDRKTSTQAKQYLAKLEGQRATN